MCHRPKQKGLQAPVCLLRPLSPRS
ncbi:hypothetical protein LINGRAHAP2_LOCUS9195 [Linum grandiflorum]